MHLSLRITILGKRLRFFAGLVLLASPLSAASADVAIVDRAFKVSIDAALTMTTEAPAQTQNLHTHTEFGYTWRSEGPTRSLIFDSVLVQAKNNGKPMMDSTMNREKFSFTENGKTTEAPAELAPPALRQMLRDSFGVPVFQRTLNEQGQETSHQVLAKTGAKKLVDTGMLANGLLFHPLPPTGQAEWQADTQISLGGGGYATGKLTYKKIEGRLGTTYAITGTLSNDNVPGADPRFVLKDVRCVVTGEETYDDGKKEWASGRLKMDIAHSMTANGQPFSTSKGVMMVTFGTRAQ